MPYQWIWKGPLAIKTDGGVQVERNITEEYTTPFAKRFGKWYYTNCNPVRLHI